MQDFYHIPATNCAIFEEKIAALNKRADKLGVPRIVVARHYDQDFYKERIDIEKRTLYWDRQTIENYLSKNRLARGIKHYPDQKLQFRCYEVRGESPKLDGWEFVATLEPVKTDTGMTNLLLEAPGKMCPVSLREVIGRCDHCQKHRKRIQTFVVYKDGKFKCVGRQCLKDFLGYNKDPQMLAMLFETLASLGELCKSASDPDWFGGISRIKPEWPIEEFLAVTVCRIEKHGWLPKSAIHNYNRERTSPTANVVLEILMPPRTTDKEIINHWKMLVAEHTPLEEHYAKAKKIVEWIVDLPEEQIEKSSYYANLNTVARSGVVTHKTAGLAASMAPAYTRFLGDKPKGQTPISKKVVSQHVGVEGKRREFTATCKFLTDVTGEYPCVLHKLEDDKGNILTWFSSRSAKLKEGCTYTFRATVKAHKEYRGNLETIITRLTKVEEIDPTLATVGKCEK